MDENKTINEEEQPIDLVSLFCDFFKGVKKFWWLLLILCSFTTALSYARIALSYSPMYESKVSFTVSTRVGYDEANTAYGFYYNQSTAEQLADIFPYLIHSDIMNELVWNEMRSSGVNGNVSIKAIPKSNLFTMSAISDEPLNAKELLEATLKHLPDVAKYVIGDTKLNIIQPPTVPEQPCNIPNYRRSAATGLMGGLLISVVFLLAYTQLHKTIRKEDEFREILNIKCFGTVPQVRFKNHNKKIDCTVSMQNERIGDYFRESVRSIALRVQRKMDENHHKVLLVTSTLSDEGKSMMAVNLALALQERGKKVLLMDMDFHNPSLAQQLGIKNFLGMSEVLRGKRPLEDAIVKLDQGIYFMGEEKTVKKAISFFTKPVLKQMVERCRAEMDYIIMDTPPCGILSDAVTLSDVSDAILYVIRQDRVKTSQAMDAVQAVVGRGTPVLGGVLNGVERSTLGGYGYGKYGYGRYGYGKYGYRKYGSYGKQ